MSRGLIVAAVAAAAVVGTVAGVFLVGRGDGDAQQEARFDERTLRLTTSVDPRVHLFGDPVTAHVDLLIDTRRVDSGRIVVDTLFRPYELVGRERRERREVGDFVRLRISYPLQCLARACSPGTARREIRFPPARVLYVLRDVRSRATVTAEWPPVVVASRLGPFDIQEARWRADVEPAAVSYRVSPGWLAAGLGGVAALLLLGAALLATRLLRGAPAEEVEEVPREARPPLERALEHVGLLSANGAAPERRRALERLARELDGADQPALAARARRVAWSARQPDPAEVDRLASDVRDVVEGRA